MREAKCLTDEWGTLPMEKFRGQVFRLQKTIFSSSMRGDRDRVHKLQKRLIASFAARCVAVARVTEENRGKGTAGIDGERNLTDGQKLRLARRLSLRQRVSPVLRRWIPKEGLEELRPLGIPTIQDRALQALMALALEPEWEVRFSPHQFGFRKGRGVADAIVTIRISIQFSPKWVLDADIEKFFDSVDHEALLAKLGTFPAMRRAIRRLLRAGAIEGAAFTETERGTPQGGILSPLLANIALHDLEGDLQKEAGRWKLADGKRPKRPPLLILYADDLVVLASEQGTIEMARDFIGGWLAKIGLRLHPEKTRITHTLEGGDGKPSFDFLGCTIRQHRVGKYAVKTCFMQVFTSITPSRKAVRRVYQKIAAVIDGWVGRPATKADYRREGWSPEESLIRELNPIILGWANAFRHCNAKRAFSRLEHLVWQKLWRAMNRRHRRRGRTWVAQHYFLADDQTWRFHCHPGHVGEELRLRLFAETAIQRHYPIQHGRSFFDGDWAYWGTRWGAYPGIPRWIGNMLRRQRGKCAECGARITRDDRVRKVPRAETTAVEGDLTHREALVHEVCDTAHRRLDVLGEGSPVGIDAVSSPVR